MAEEAETPTTDEAPASDGEFPKMLYRKGNQIEHESLKLDTITVESNAAEAAARKDGFAELHKVAKAKGE